MLKDKTKKIVQFSSTGKLLYYIRCVHSVKNHQNSKYRTTRFQLILPVQSQNVTKNRTDHRMHVEGIQICQINRWNNSFQNMYSMNRQKLTVWPGKLILCQKTPHFCLTVDTRSITWVPLKTLGYNALN